MKRSFMRGIAFSVLGIGCLISSGSGYADIESLIVPYTAIEDVVYGQKEGMGLTLDVLQPEQNRNGIGILLISSGSWKSSKSNVPEEVAEFRRDHWGMGLLHSGFTVFVVRHGSGPRFHVPEMIEDIRRSARFVRLKASDYAIDPDHIGITSGLDGRRDWRRRQARIKGSRRAGQQPRPSDCFVVPSYRPHQLGSRGWLQDD